MEISEQVINTLKNAGKALSAGQIAELSGIERKDVDKAMKKLKSDGIITSPKNCFWEIAN